MKQTPVIDHLEGLRLMIAELKIYLSETIKAEKRRIRKYTFCHPLNGKQVFKIIRIRKKQAASRCAVLKLDEL